MTPELFSRAPDDDLRVLLIACAGDARLRRQRALAEAGLAVRLADGEAEAAAQAQGLAVAVIDAGGNPASLAGLLRALRGDAADPPPVVLLGGVGHDALLHALGDAAAAVVDLLPSDADDHLLVRKVAALARLRAGSARLRRRIR